MDQYRMASAAISEKARSERIFMNYALSLAVFLAIAGTALVLLGVGDHLDILVKGQGGLEARLVNGTPGVALWMISAAVFFAAKPRQLKATASHSGGDVQYARGDEDSEMEAPRAGHYEPSLDTIKQLVREMVEREVQNGARSLGRVTRVSEDRLHETTETLSTYLQNEVHVFRQQLARDANAQPKAPSPSQRASGRSAVYYQEDLGPTATGSDSNADH